MSTTIPPSTSDRARLVALIIPKEGLSFEDFDRYWAHEHAKTFASLSIVKQNLLRYEQVYLIVCSVDDMKLSLSTVSFQPWPKSGHCGARCRHVAILGHGSL